MFHEIKVHCSFVFYIDCKLDTFLLLKNHMRDKLTQGRTAPDRTPPAQLTNTDKSPDGGHEAYICVHACDAVF